MIKLEEFARKLSGDLKVFMIKNKIENVNAKYVVMDKKKH